MWLIICLVLVELLDEVVFVWLVLRKYEKKRMVERISGNIGFI